MVNSFIKLFFIFCSIIFYNRLVLSNDLLFFAVREKNIEVIQALLDNGVDPDSPSSHGYVALRSAARNCYIEGMQALFNAGANPDVTDSIKDTPLMAAPFGSCTEGMELLLNRGADPNHQNQNGDTAFTSAVTSGFIPAIELLVNAGGDINLPNYKGNTAFMLAASMGNAKVMQMLLDHDVKNPHAVNVNNEGALFMAARDGHIEAVNLLLNIDVDIDLNIANRYQKTPLMAAVEARIIALQSEEFGIVIGHGPPESPSENYIPIIDSLLKAKANPNAIDQNDYTALIYATFANDIEVVRLLLPYENNPGYANPRGYSASLIASLNGDVEIARLIRKAIDEKK